MLHLPEFDSLPAIASLDNAEAFRLSIQHALALLPIVLARTGNVVARPENPERFSLR